VTLPNTDAPQGREAQALAFAPTELLIAGEWREASEGSRFWVEDPATGEPLCDVADATVSDAQEAIAAAADAQDAWAATPPNDRAQILWRAFEMLQEKADVRGFKMSVHAAARWYSWMSPPSRSRRLISLPLGCGSAFVGSDGSSASAR
jgi:hypothetical protein